MESSQPSEAILNIHLTLLQYPILGSRIRARMRQELFRRGIIQVDTFETETRQKALISQEREGLNDPFAQEPAEMWDLRLRRIRDALTDFYFAYNLPYPLFEDIIRQSIRERSGEQPDLAAFNPELAPQDMLFDQARAIEAMPEGERKRWEARLQEIKVVLIRTMISDQLAYIKIAKQWFTVGDLQEIRRRKIGQGKIGGKSAGMLLAVRILNEVGGEQVKASLKIPVSYYLGADVFNTYMAFNGLMPWGDQKYKSETQMRREYPTIQSQFSAGRFPEEIITSLKEILNLAGKQPLIVRSSSLLEDSFGTSFAGKYDSFFCPNQGSPKKNLHDLTHAIAMVYASELNPNALLYRIQKGLVDYDERIAVLIQFVEGQAVGDYYLPQAAGVAFSRNLYRWSPQIRPEDGFLRLVWGLGTRAVDQLGDDHPRLVALSHPELHPADSIQAIRHYSQHYVDLIDLKENELKTLPVQEVLSSNLPTLRFMTEVEEDGYLHPLSSNLADPQQLVITFNGLLHRTPFAGLMRQMLSTLEKHYGTPVDTEFALQVPNPQAAQPQVSICLLQCRPQSHLSPENEVKLPTDLPAEQVIFATRRMVPRGRLEGIRWVLFVPPEGYFSLGSQTERNKLERAIGRLNSALQGQDFICVGPGRWGTSTPDLGVHISYADIYNTRALVEVSGQGIGSAPEPSFGTHFFQDLMEAQIYPLAVFLDDPDARFSHEFFYNTPNRLGKWLKADAGLKRCLHLVQVSDYRPGHHLTLVMNDDLGQALAYLEKDE